MKIVLLDNIKGIGKVGDIKDVSDGYARNFVIPRKLGRPASNGAVKEAEVLKSQRLEAQKMEHAQAEELVKKLEGIAVVLKGKSNEKGKLFSAITPAEIAKEISKEVGAHISPDAIEGEHIKTIGEHTVRINLPSGLSADLKVTVIPVP